MEFGFTKQVELVRKNRSDKALAGYYVLETSELNLNPNIFAKNKNKAEIEKIFRILKSKLVIRPLYLQTSNHIESMILIRFTACNVLLALRELLDDKYSTEKIAKSLSLFRCVKDGNHYILFGRDQIIQELEDLFYFTKNRIPIIDEYKNSGKMTLIF